MSVLRHGDEALTNAEEIVAQKCHGIRPARGYPAQPGHTEKRGKIDADQVIERAASKGRNVKTAEKWLASMLNCEPSRANATVEKLSSGGIPDGLTEIFGSAPFPSADVLLCPPGRSSHGFLASWFPASERPTRQHPARSHPRRMGGGTKAGESQEDKACPSMRAS